MKQREIKFRAWTKRDKCWIGGFSVHQSGLFSDLINAHIEEPQHIAIADAHWQDLKNQDEIILMQFTGLKDKNGVEIFEGDKVKYTHNSDTYEIGFDSGAFHLHSDYQDSLQLPVPPYPENFEVIGNIYEN